MSLIPPIAAMPMERSYSVCVRRSSAACSGRDWLPFATGAGDVWMDARYLRAVEAGLAGAGEFWNLVVRQGTKPVAAAFVSRYAIDSLLFVQGCAKEMIQWGRRFCPDLFKFKVLFCGTPVSTGESHLRLAPGINADDVWPILDRALLRLARAQGTQLIVLKEFDADEVAGMSGLDGLGYLKADSLPMNYLPTQFRDFDHLCAGMRSRYRNQIQRSRKKFAKAGLRVEHVRDGRAIERLYTDEVHRLYLAVLARAAVKLESLPAEFFRALAREFPRDIAFTFVYKDERIVGFVCSLFHGEHYFNLFCGVDYAVNEESDLYFNLMFHDADYALRHGVKSLHVGQTADDFKSRMGCYTKPRYFFVKGTNRLMQWILRRGAAVLFPPVPPPPQHNIFTAAAR